MFKKIIKIIFTIFIGLILLGSCANIASKNNNNSKENVKKEATKKETKKIKEETKKTKEQLAKEKHQEWIKKQFDVWDGSHKELKKLVKENLNDPKSFKHVESRYWVQGEDIVVSMTYRAKNGFNATITDMIKAKITYKDNKLTVLD